jgi:DNA-binding transcriptional regulator YhcF (GntR family)
VITVTIDHLSGEPAYQQLARVLREGIVSGTYAVGTQVPSAKTLSQQHGIAVGTVMRAFDVLRDEGLIRSVPGRGMFVVMRPA